jgi:hypothetical protein
MKYLTFIFFVSIVTSTFINNSYIFSPSIIITQPKISIEAKKYLTEVINILKMNSVKRKDINWVSFENNILSRAINAKNIEETYPSITAAINELGDGHSYFLPKNSPIDNSKGNDPPKLSDESVPYDIGYIRVPYCIGNQGSEDYIQTLLKNIKKRDNKHLKGWIVDLRGNFGGNMWPMIVGIGSILGDGNLGYFIDPDGKLQSWKYKKGKAFLDQNVIKETKELIHLKIINPYVAVITDSLTASSGEAIAIAFKGRNKTKSFGFRTYGVSTCNKPFHLSDGSIINLTTSVFVDRNKHFYGKSIEPDKVCNPNDGINEAITWLRKQY